MKMTKVCFTGITNMGCCIYGCEVFLPEDWTMNQLVKELKEQGYKMFMLNTMKRFAEVR